MELNYKNMLKALALVEDEKNISEEVILDALKEAMAKAYKKNAELQDIDVVAELNEKKKMSKMMNWRLAWQKLRHMMPMRKSAVSSDVRLK